MNSRSNYEEAHEPSGWIAKALYKRFEDGGMDRPLEFYSGDMAFDPTHHSLKRLDPLQLNPKLLVELRALNEFDPASFWRQIENSDTIRVPSSAP